jgi:hypothetical protein
VVSQLIKNSVNNKQSRRRFVHTEDKFFFGIEVLDTLRYPWYEVGTQQERNQGAPNFNRGHVLMGLICLIFKFACVSVFSTASSPSTPLTKFHLARYIRFGLDEGV